MSELTRRMLSWHRPMMLFAAGSAVLAAVSLGGMIWDDRILLGMPIWAKLFKFAVSFVAYGVTWAWMISLLTRGRRLAGWLSTVLVAMLVIEYVVMFVQVVRGRPSHFNVSTPLDASMWAVMAGSIAVLWVCTFVLTGVLFRSPIADPASRWAIRLGSLVALVGLGLGGLMTSPTADQLRSPTGMIGAHSVGVADGGPGMLITGWSTIGGDLRIPHFVGMHALQALPLLVIGLGLLARRLPRLRDELVRTRLVLVAAGGYAGLVALVTWQALRGQPLIYPDGLTLAAGGGLVVVTAAAVVGVVRAGGSPTSAGPARERVKV